MLPRPTERVNVALVNLFGFADRLENERLVDDDAGGRWVLPLVAGVGRRFRHRRAAAGDFAHQLFPRALPAGGWPRCPMPRWPLAACSASIRLSARLRSSTLAKSNSV